MSRKVPTAANREHGAAVWILVDEPEVSREAELEARVTELAQANLRLAMELVDRDDVIEAQARLLREESGGHDTADIEVEVSA